jgi:nucleoside-diphosphate-sugar epimerase
MKLLMLVSLALSGANAFTPAPLNHPSPRASAIMFAEMDRRSMLGSAAASLAFLALQQPALAEDEAAAAAAAPIQKIVVAGATGQTGRRVLERLAAAQAGGAMIVGGVRNVAKATASLSEASTVVRGAMLQQVGSIDTTGVDLKHLDVVTDTVSDLTLVLQGASSLVIATGFVPGNPLKMNEAAHLVDNVGTCKLIDAAKAAGVKKIVMVSSILTNGRNWGQESSPGFIVTNAFGKVLDEKLVAENYLRASGIDYTIVRPGGLKAKPPSGALIISGEDTLNSGEVSRDLVADVCVASLTDPKASNKVLEIIENDEAPPKVFNGLVM